MNYAVNLARDTPMKQLYSPRKKSPGRRRSPSPIKRALTHAEVDKHTMKHAQLVQSFAILYIICFTLLASAYRDSLFWPFYSVSVCTSLTTRWVLYKRKGMHYFLLDYCYLVNLIVLFAVNFQQHYEVAFLLTHGCIANSMWLFRNALVLDSWDKLSTLSVHLLPTIATYLLRWYPSCPESAILPALTLTTAFWQPFAIYLSWVCVYTVINFGWCKHRIQTRKYLTLWGFISGRPEFHKICQKLGLERSWQSYMVCHAGHFLGLHFVALVAYRSWAFDFGMCLAYVLRTVWVGAKAGQGPVCLMVDKGLSGRKELKSR